MTLAPILAASGVYTDAAWEAANELAVTGERGLINLTAAGLRAQGGFTPGHPEDDEDDR